jgi:hypothetical protein
MYLQFFFIAKEYPIHCMDVLQIIIPLPVERLFGHFQSLAITTETSTDIHL